MPLKQSTKKNKAINSFIKKAKDLPLFHKTMIAIAIFASLAFFNYHISSTKGATFGWLQTDWSGGLDITAKAGHLLDQTGWTKFFATSSPLLTDNGELKLGYIASSTSETSDADFNAGNKTDNIYIASSTIYAKKPNSYVCESNNNNLCQSGRCDSTCQAKLADGEACDESSDCQNYCNGGSCTATRPPCGDDSTFTDARDGTVYPLVSIGTQCWFAKNLAYLPSVSGSVNQPAWAGYFVYGYQGGDVAAAKATANYNNYGVLYQGWIVSNVCPSGSHLPTQAEWTTLKNNTSGCNNNGSPLKISWWGGANTYGFGILPGGFKDTNNEFVSFGGVAAFWTGTASSNGIYYAYITGDYCDLAGQDGNKNNGFSVRCIKD